MGGARALRVGVTGVESDLGNRLMPLLKADARVDRVVAFDIAPPRDRANVDWVRADLTRPGVEAELTRAMAEAKLDALFHLAFVNSRVHGAAFAHELEVIGSLSVFAAAAANKVGRLIVPSLTVLYGARPGGPSLLTESHPLLGCPGSRFISDRVEVERQLEGFKRASPDSKLVVLRFAPMVGPTASNPFTRLLKTRVIPTPMGFDPLWQAVHEDDCARALHLALHSEATGAFNIVAEGALPFSSLVRLAGARTVPLPTPLLQATLRGFETAGVSVTPLALLDYLHYNCVADGSRARRELGFVPRVPLREAMMSIRSGGS